jgi:tRNA(fMet)-specific endonuclease VapC
VSRLSQTKTNYLLDTSVLIDLIGQRPGIQHRLAQAGDLYYSVTVLGELLYGAAHSINPAKSRSDIDAIIQIMTLLAHDARTAEFYADIKHDLRLKGQMIPDNDLWIAATALQAGLTLAARDTHFARVAGLPFEHW